MKGWADRTYPYRANGRHSEKTHLRLFAFQKYGGRCQCPGGCEVEEPEFLTWDHVDGNGAEHKELLLGDVDWQKNGGRGHAGLPIPELLKKAGWPDSPEVRHEGRLFRLRILCNNCNGAFFFKGYCPHDPTIRAKKEETPTYIEEEESQLVFGGFE